MNKRQALTKLLLQLSEYFKSPLSNVELDIYLDNLMEYRFKAIKEAAKKLVKTERFMPKVADFVKAIEEEEGKLAEKAWLEVEEQIDSVGIYGNPKFKDITIYAVVQAMGGWEAFCNMPVDRKTFYMKEFINLYNIYKNKPEIIVNALPEGKKQELKALAKIMALAKEKQALGSGNK